MKKFLFTILVTLLYCCIVLDACTPDAPPENTPRYIDGLQFNPDYFQGPGLLTSISPGPSPCIPGQGNCTMILPSSPTTSLNMKVAFYNFKRYFNNNDIAGFFSRPNNWDKLFPGLQQDPKMLKEIINGTYKVQVAKDDQAIVFFKGLFPVAGNIIRAYWFNNIHRKATHQTSR